MNDEAKMEVVKAFNNELVSLYDIKPPISKAKMTAITKAAMKSVKFYKHVVHGVEKFILKCRPDYKIPGLYVIDSIVRQSRHQFGVEKDVFAPRFSKNLLQTFKNICLCPEDDKQKLVRVINLWQKHKVFPEELLKKFLVMAEASEDELPDLYKDEIEAIQKSSKKSPTSGKKKKKSPLKTLSDSLMSQNSFYSNSILNSSVNSTSRMEVTSKPSVDPVLIQQLQTLTSLLQQSTGPTVNASPAASNVTPSNDQVKFDRKLLEYDYGEEEEEGSLPVAATQSLSQAADPISSILTNPEVIRQLQNLQFLSMAQAKPAQTQDMQMAMLEHQRLLQAQQMQALNQAFFQQQYQQPDSSNNFFGAFQAMSEAVAASNSEEDTDDKPEIVMEKQATEPLEVIDLDRISTPPGDRRRRSYSRSRSRSISPRHRHRSRNRRSRSRSWSRDRNRDDDANEERHRRALPPIKRKHIAVCSTTLWVGHLSKLIQEQDLSDTFGEYGDIVSIDLIPPRGCAFLCMNRRQDAHKALHRLKHTKIHGKPMTIAWAPGKGMKGREWKDYWEGEYGVSYIPWNKLTPNTDYDLLEEGGMLDQETMPNWLKSLLEEKRKISYPRSKALYTPSGTDMDESSNECDDSMQRNALTMSSDMIIEPTNGSLEHMIPLPDGPQPMELPHLGIPLPPPPPQNPGGSQSTINIPPPNPLINPFGLPPRLLTPMGMIGGNFMPPLGVPPPVPGLLMSPQQMLNRLPPPFTTGPPGLPMLNPGPNPNTSLSQIPLPDTSTVVTSAVTTSASDFKPPPFGLAPLIFPGNPNIKIDMPGNAHLNVPLPSDSNDMDLSNDERNPDNSSIFSNAFPNLSQFPKSINLTNLSMDNMDRNEIDTDYRVLSDLNNSNVMSIETIDNQSDTSNNKNYNRDNNSVDRQRGRNDFSRDNRDYRYDRNPRERDNKYERDYRSPYRDDGFDKYKYEREDFRRTRFDRDYKRGRDFRGGRSRDQGPAPNRARGRSRERDYRDTRRDYRNSSSGDDKTKRFDKRGHSRERMEDNSFNQTIKKTRWEDKEKEPSWEVAEAKQETWNAPVVGVSTASAVAPTEEENWDIHIDNWQAKEDWNSTSGEGGVQEMIPTIGQDKKENWNKQEESWDNCEENLSKPAENWDRLGADTETSRKNSSNNDSETHEGQSDAADQSWNGSVEKSIPTDNAEGNFMVTQRDADRQNNSVLSETHDDNVDSKVGPNENDWAREQKDGNDEGVDGETVPLETFENNEHVWNESLPESLTAGGDTKTVVERETETETENNASSSNVEYDMFHPGNSPPLSNPNHLQSTPPRFREPRPAFQNRIPSPIGRGGPPPLLNHFGTNSPAGPPFPGHANFRPRFQALRPHPPFFNGPPRHFSPRSFMQPRPNNF